MNRAARGRWLPVALGILIETGAGIEINLASDKVPKILGRTGVVLAGLVLTFGLAAILQLRDQRRRVPALSHLIRVRLINRAKVALAEMASAVLDESGVGQLDLRVTVKLPEQASLKRFVQAPAQSAEMRLGALPDYVDQHLDGRALIVGPPGGGKSTLMRAIARRSIERSEGNATQVPLWLDMEEWPDGTSLESWVRDSLAARKVSGENAQLMLENNDLYLFLDGLDQIPTQDGQRRAFKAAEEFLERYEFCHLVMTSRSEAYAALGAAAEHLALVKISPLTPIEVGAQLRRAGALAAGLRQAAAQSDALAEALNTPLFLKAALRAFRGWRTQTILDLHRTGGWDDVILAELVRLVLIERKAAAIEPQSLLSYLTWLARVFVEAGATSFYGFVPPRRLLDSANRNPRTVGPRTVATVLAGAVAGGSAGWLLVGPLTAVVTGLLSGVGICVWLRVARSRLDLEMTESRDEVVWSTAALRAAAPRLAVRLCMAVAVASLAQFIATYEINRIAQLGQMTTAAKTSARFYVAAILVVLLIRYLAGAVTKAGRVVKTTSVSQDIPVDHRRAQAAWWLRPPELSLAFLSSGAFLLWALTWTSGYQLLATLKDAHLRYSTIQSIFRELLGFMDFSARSPLHRHADPLWAGVATAIGFGLGLVITWLDPLGDWSRASAAAYERDAGHSQKDMVDMLDYGVQLSLLTQVQGRYSFYHPRLLEFFSGNGPRAIEVSTRTETQY
ncbi:NACHT domain-containing protein [Kribbella sp. NPDC026611]|uniref:NACHT domain-containing protein n=1 Tax=Kribbella sp. NPDC026611 TaxID=3154911 RepID=UPI0033CAB26F